MNIGERLKRIRKEKGMTQDSVAERAGVTATSISRWENGERDPTFRDVEKIAAALGVTMEELTREQKRGTGIRKIIDGKLYDTGNARILFTFRRKYQDPLNPLFFGENMVHVEWEDAQYLKTERRRVYPDIRSGRGRVKGGKAVESGSYSNNHFNGIIRRRGIFSGRGYADYIRVRE